MAEQLTICGATGKKCSECMPCCSNKVDRIGAMNCLQFTDSEYEMILQYKTAIKAISAEVAIMNAISLALDRAGDQLHAELNENTVFHSITDEKGYGMVGGRGR